MGEGLLVAVKNDPNQTFTRSSVANKTRVFENVLQLKLLFRDNSLHSTCFHLKFSAEKKRREKKI